MSADVIVSEFGSRREGYAAPSCEAHGAARSSLFAPSAFSLWQVVGELDEGTELTWNGDHGDEGLYVTDGSLEVDGQRCVDGGAVVIESGVPTVVRAVTATRVVHSGSHDRSAPISGPLGPPSPDDHQVHVFATAEDAPLIRATGRPVSNSMFTDGTCPRCRIALFIVDGRVATDGYVGTSHLHSADELIHVLDGELRFGRDVVGSGETIAIPADRRYSFRTPEGFRFLNYRRDAATATFAPGSDPVLETIEGIAAAGIGTPS